MSDAGQLEEVIPFALDAGYDLLLLSGAGPLASTWPELQTRAPDLRVLRDAVSILRRLDREEEIDLVYYGGVRTGTDAGQAHRPRRGGHGPRCLRRYCRGVGRSTDQISASTPISTRRSARKRLPISSGPTPVKHR